MPISCGPWHPLAVTSSDVIALSICQAPLGVSHNLHKPLHSGSQQALVQEPLAQALQASTSRPGEIYPAPTSSAALPQQQQQQHAVEAHTSREPDQDASRKRQRTATPERQDQQPQPAGARSGEAAGGRGVEEDGMELAKAAAEPVQVGNQGVQEYRGRLCWSISSQSACFSAEGLQVLFSSRRHTHAAMSHADWHPSL